MSEELDARAPYLLKRSLSTARMAHTLTSMTFYESILRRGLLAGGQHGKTTRKHVHVVEYLLHDGPISGMRSDCDLVIWIKTREAAASGLIFFRSANDVILTEETIEPSFFHSAQIMQSSEVTPVTDRPPHPQQVALAISRAPLQATASRGRDAQNRRQYMLLEHAHCQSHAKCTHSLWTYTCGHYAHIKAQAAPLATGASEVRVELFDQAKETKTTRISGCSSFSKFIKAVMELSAHPITYILRSSNIVSPNITLRHTPALTNHVLGADTSAPLPANVATYVRKAGPVPSPGYATGQMLTREEEASCFQQHFTIKFTAETPSSTLEELTYHAHIYSHTTQYPQYGYTLDVPIITPYARCLITAMKCALSVKL